MIQTSLLGNWGQRGSVIENSESELVGYSDRLQALTESLKQV